MNVNKYCKFVGARSNTSCVISKLGNADKVMVQLDIGQVYSMNIESDIYAKINCSTSVLLAQYAKSGNGVNVVIL